MEDGSFPVEPTTQGLGTVHPVVIPSGAHDKIAAWHWSDRAAATQCGVDGETSRGTSMYFPAAAWILVLGSVGWPMSLPRSACRSIDAPRAPMITFG